ncbi:VWA domain-containing protein [Bryobacter aggregatus]|uniref:VWA domain-containing protein n=1 Tax=Bryobacter aggregatus TaxID=360054 RepID=UPI0004E1E6A9|nr:VWA domain-containing protein [Bryobacter aggregatus]
MTRRDLFSIPLAAMSLRAQEQPIFSSNTQLVVETVSVKDKKGNSISGLTAKDFTLTEDGKQQSIAFVEFQKLPDDPAPDAAYTASVAPVARLARTQIAAEKPGDIRYRDRRLLALYFDFSAMQPADQLRALSAAQNFVRKQMTTADLMAVMIYSSGAVQVLEDFTADRAKLLETLQTLLVGEEAETATNPGDASAVDSGAAFGQNDAEFNLFNTDRQLSALQTAATMLGRLSEKKSLLYFASGLRLNGADNQAQLNATINAAIRAGVSFWPIDARGLVATPPMGDATRGSTGGIGMYNGAAGGATMSNFQRSQDTLYALAADTGGKALIDSNDLGKGIEQAQKATNSYYLIGYYTSNPALDGKLRRVKITLNNGLIADLDYRQSFYAGKQFQKFTAADKERQLEDALMLGDPITELTIALEVNYFQLNRAEYFVPVAVKIPGSELARAKRGGAERTLIDFMGEIKEGQLTVANVRDKVELKLSGQTASELATHPITYDTGFTLLPGSYTLKILARDAETGRIGTYLRSFVIPNLNREDKRVPLSSVVLSGQSVDMQEALFNTKDKLKAQSLNPLVQGGQKMIPSVTRVFSRSREMQIYLQTYQQEPEIAKPMVGYVSFYQGAKKVFETAPIVGAEAAPGRLKMIPLLFRIPLGKMPPGEYNCQVTVLNPEAQRASFWQAPVMLIP